MKSRFICTTVCVGVLSGCANQLDFRQSIDNHEYLDEVDIDKKPLNVPKDYLAVQEKSEYEIPAIKKELDNEKIGTEIDTRPPAQVIAASPRTRINSEQSSHSVIIDTYKKNDNVLDEVNQAIDRYFEQEDIKKRSGTSTKLETEWVDYTTIIDSGIISDDSYSFRQRYQLDLKQASNKRYVKLDVKTLEYDVPAESQAFINEKERNYREVDLINGIILTLGQSREEQYKEIEKQLDDINVTLIDASTGDKVWQINTSFQKTWDLMPSVLSDLGFTVEDWDRSQKTYYAKYTDEKGFWGSIFGSDVFPLENQIYQFKLTNQNRKQPTVVQILDNEGKPIGNDVVQEMNPDFKDYMESN